MSAALSQAWKTLLAHKVKSILAVIAIVWGLVSIIVLMALGEGFYQHYSASFSLLNSDSQYVQPSQTSKPWQGLPVRRKIRITEQQVERLRESPFIEQLAIVYENWEARVSDAHGISITSFVAGTEGSYLPLIKQGLTKGSRNLNHSDERHHSRVALVGDLLASRSHLAVGDTIKVHGIPFQVIGILADADGVNFFGNFDRVFIPSSTFQDIWKKEISNLMVKPVPGVNGEQLRRNLIDFFAKQEHFDPNDNDALYLPDFSASGKVLMSILHGIQIFLACSGAMTLAVGALGVANIMFLSVTERTREIGVRLAIGAAPRTILAQFLIEGMLLAFFGALLGLSIAILVVFLLGKMHLPSWIGVPVVTSDSIGVALFVTCVLAILAAYFPARRAAGLTPVVALSARV